MFEFIFDEFIKAIADVVFIAAFGYACCARDMNGLSKETVYQDALDFSQKTVSTISKGERNLYNVFQ